MRIIQGLLIFLACTTARSEELLHDREILVKSLHELVANSPVVVTGKVTKIDFQRDFNKPDGGVLTLLTIKPLHYSSVDVKKISEFESYSSTEFDRALNSESIDLQISTIGLLKDSGDKFFEVNGNYIFFLDVRHGAHLIYNSNYLLPALRHSKYLDGLIGGLDACHRSAIKGERIQFPKIEKSNKNPGQFEIR